MSKFATQKIVLFADQRLTVDTARSALRRMGIGRCAVFASGKEGLEHLYANPADILIVDDGFDGQNPFAFVAKLRIDTSIMSRLVPVILLSNDGHPQTIMRAIKAGIDEVLIKPLAEKTICDRIERTIVSPRKCIQVPSGYVGPDRRRSIKEFMKGEDRRSNDKAQIISRAATPK